MIRHNSTQHNTTQHNTTQLNSTKVIQTQKQPRSVAPVYALKEPCQVFLSTLWKANIHIYYSTLAPFYHIRSRERAKYATVLHSKIMYCTAKSRFHRFSGRRTGKTIFWRDFFKWNNKSLIRWLNIIIIRADILLIARIFPGPFGARKNTTQLAKYPRVLYVKPSNKMYLHWNLKIMDQFCSDAILLQRNQ